MDWGRPGFCRKEAWVLAVAAGGLGLKQRGIGWGAAPEGDKTLGQGGGLRAGSNGEGGGVNQTAGMSTGWPKGPEP